MMATMSAASGLLVAFRTMIVPMALPESPDDDDVFLRFLSEIIGGNGGDAEDGDVRWPSSSQMQLAREFCWLMRSGNLTPQNVAKSLGGMEPLDLRALWIKAQNAALLVHRADANSCSIYAWTVQLPTAEVLRPENLRQRVPEAAVRVPWTTVKDEAFAELIYDLSVNEQPEALPRSSKGDGTVHEARNAIDPMFVTGWLVRALGGAAVPANEESSRALHKKVRDEARYGRGESLWRRCPSWLALKGAMHLAGRLIEARSGPSRSESDLKYKLWVCSLLTNLIDGEGKINKIQEHEGASAALEGSRKLARRVEKLRIGANPGHWEACLGPSVLQACCEAVGLVDIQLKRQWEERCEQPVHCRVKLTEQSIAEGLCHKLRNCESTIKELLGWDGVKECTSGATPPPALRRVRQVDLATVEGVERLTHHLPNQEGNPRQIIASLHDVKENVMASWQEGDRFGARLTYDSHRDGRDSRCCAASKWSISLLKLMDEYIKLSKTFHKGDVRAQSSHAILIGLSMMLLLDRVNCRLFPLLAEHKIGIELDSPAFLDALCLSTKRDKKHLHSLEQYLRGRDSVEGKSYLSTSASEGSFEVKFARGSPDMCRVRVEIQKKCSRQADAKSAEFRRERERYDRLVEKINQSYCRCRYNGYYRTYKCEHCNWMDDKNNINVFFHERLLPRRDADQLLAVYELREPSPLSCLRESVHLFGRCLLDEGGSILGGFLAQGPYDWRDDTRLASWCKSRPSLLKLASSTKPWIVTHYSSQHVTQHPSFIVDNGKNCGMSADNSEGKRCFIQPTNNWNYSVLRMCRVKLHQPRYDGLEPFAVSWQHNENQVICKKSEAHRDKKVASLNIPLTEFEALGRLRAGETLQLERLIKCIDQRSVQFREEDVITVVHALLWQVGPACQFDASYTLTWCREVWRRLCSDPMLVDDCSRHCGALLQDASKNWDAHNVLLVIVLITRALFEHCGGAAVESVMRSARRVAIGWLGEVMEKTHHCQEEEEVQIMLEKTAAISSIGVLTFAADSVMMRPSDVPDFLYFRAVGRDSLALSSLKSHSWQRQYHLLAEEVAEEVLSRVHGFIIGSEILDKFLRRHWAEAQSACRFTTSWARCGQFGSDAEDCWYETQVSLEGVPGDLPRSCHVKFDILGGLFLVDGKPCKRLSDSITCHPMYERLFGCAVLDVQADSSGGFITRTKIDGAAYSFWEPQDKGGNPIIEERREGRRSLLVHHRAMQNVRRDSLDDFPRQLIEEYSHWITFDGDKTQLRFRPKNYIEESFASRFDYILHILTKQVEVMKDPGCFLVDIASRSHAELCSNIFSRVAMPYDIHAFSKPTVKTSVLAEVVLPCLANHRFQVMRNSESDYNDICAVDHSNLLVATDQNFGTLVGLQNGLLLVGTERFRNMHENSALLMPHGKVIRTNDNEVSVNVDALKQPPFFKYELRASVRDIHPPRSRLACTYLALLHGSTSGLFPDPFLETTGTSMALDLLRSARSCGNLLTSQDSESIAALQKEVDTLVRICLLSPSRSYYPSGMREMEVVEAPSSASSLAHHNAFAFLANQRIGDIRDAAELVSQKIQLSKNQQNILSATTGDLSKRALLKSLALYSMDCNATDSELVDNCGEHFEQWNARSTGTRYYPVAGYNPAVLSSVSRLGSLAARFQHLGLFKAIKPQSRCRDTNSGLVKALLQNPSLEKLCGQERKREGRLEFSSITALANCLSEPTVKDRESKQPYTDFCNVFTPLYNISRSNSSYSKSESGRLKIGLLICFLGQRYPEHTEHLAQLLFVQEHCEAFSRLDPPDHPTYTRPSKDAYIENEIKSVAKSALEDFTERYPKYGSDWDRTQFREREREHDRQKQQSLNEIIAVAQRSWDRRGSVTSSDLPYNKVQDRTKLATRLSEHLKHWKHAEELTFFIRDFEGLLRRCGNTTLSSVHGINVTDVDVSRRPVALAPIQFRLQTLKDEEQLLLGLEEASVAKTMQAVSFSLVLPTSGIQNTAEVRERGGAAKFQHRLPQLLSIIGPDYKEMTEFAMEKIHKGWDQATQEGDGVDISSLLNSQSSVSILSEAINAYMSETRGSCDALLQLIRSINTGPTILTRAGLWNCSTRAAVLRKLKSRWSNVHVLSNAHIQLGIALRECQRARRCLSMIDRGEQHHGRLQRELEHWEFYKSERNTRKYDPMEHPEWLLLEVDNDYAIRRSQAEVAEELLSSSDNRLLKLNMGEGKTSVIIPMMVATLGWRGEGGGGPMARVTVLQSLYPNCTSQWQWRLGGLLGQRIYPMIFRRDLNFSASQAMKMLKNLRQACKCGHFIVTTPEHRLSFENKLVELACEGALKHDPETSEGLLGIRRFLCLHACDLLDESDLILSPKLQLVYTLGNPEDMDGSDYRWAVCAAALQSVGDMARELLVDFPRLVEVTLHDKPRVSTVRLLEGDGSNVVWQRIRERVYQDIVIGRGISTKHDEVKKPRLLESEKQHIFDIIMNEEFDLSLMGESAVTLSDGHVRLALILRGLLTFDALRFALSKRHRVDYGAHKLRPSYLMAVPFRAKDVAAGQTEFKHPDIMVLLTLCHYYNYGLSQQQLRSVLEKLASMPEASAKALFSRWSSQIHASSEETGSVVLDFDSVNLADANQFRKQLVPQFEHHVEAIDFFLFRRVFPIQAKEFKDEISANSYDLCPIPNSSIDQPRYATVGFSGTDNLEPVLPATVKQQNLPSLEVANALQIKHLLRPENNVLEVLVANGNAEDEIFTILSSDKSVNVMLDPGALILGLNNMEFASKWLQRRPDKEAAVFFDDGDRECVITKQGEVTERNKSPFADDLSKCLVYLDDLHTRGVDFLLPSDSRAAITLGKGMCDAKLVQAAWRMRLLGNGQSLHFVASEEVGQALHQHLKQLAMGLPKDIANILAIFAWAVRNSIMQNCELMTYSSAQGAAHLRRLKAFGRLGDISSGADMQSSLVQLAESLVQTDNLELKHLYGNKREAESLPQIVGRHLSSFIDLEVAQVALKRANELVPKVMRMQSKFSNEMERELEQELEEEIQIEKPPPAKPATPSVSPGMKAFIAHGIRPGDAIPLGACSGALVHTSLHNTVQGNANESVFVSRDFCRTLRSKTTLQDGHTKTPEWLLHHKPTGAVLIISNFEAEHVAKGMMPPMTRSGPGLRLFSPVRRLRQAGAVLSCDKDFDPPASLHVYAGSIQASGDVLRDMTFYIGLIPAAYTRTQSMGDLEVERDGFIPRASRKAISLTSRDLSLLRTCPFNSSPINFLCKLYSNIYCLGEELSTSTFGHLLGAAALGNDNGDVA